MKLGIEPYFSQKVLNSKNNSLNKETFKKLPYRTLYTNRSVLNDKSKDTYSFLKLKILDNNKHKNYDYNNNNDNNNNENNNNDHNNIYTKNINGRKSRKYLLLNLIPFMNIKNLIKGKEIPILYSKSQDKKKTIKSFYSPNASRYRVITFSSLHTNKSQKFISNINKISKINFFDDYEKEFFPDIDYSNLKYKESEIYGNTEKYETLIKEKIKYFQKFKNENHVIKLEKNFKYGKYKKDIKLTLNSLKITFNDMSKPEELYTENLKVIFPFSLLPLFYYKGFESFIKLLSQIIKVDNNFEEIYFDENSLVKALNNVKEYKINAKKKEELKSKTLNSKNLLSIMSKSIKFDDKEIIIKSPTLNKSKNFLKYNNFIFYWTTNTHAYSTRIFLPTLTLNILDENIIINNYIDYELLFFLYKRNFLNWEYYIIKYLSSYSKFRSIIRKLDNNIRLYNKNFFLKEPKTKINSFFDDTLLNIYTDQFNRNQIIEFKSFYINIYFSDLNYSFEKKYHIFFNFVQYLKLYEISKYSDKIYFLIKFLEINNETHSLNFNFREYDEFDINAWMDNIKKFSSKSLKNNIEEKLTGEFEIYSKKVKIEFRKPKWSFMRLEDEKEKVKSWEIGKELEIDFVQCMYHQNSESWTTLINECLKKINEPIPILPQLSSKKKFKRMATKNFGSNLRSKGYRLSKISQ